MTNKKPHRFGGVEKLKWNLIKEEILNKITKCEVCGKIKKLELHHKKPYSTHPELMMEKSNLMAVCRECHNQIHNKNDK